jgi:restriction endonuclease S subunit
MNGLEAVEIKLSEVITEKTNPRFDSEYFKKKYLIEDKNRSRLTNKLLNDFSFITDGQHGYHEVDEHSNINFLTAKNAKNWFADIVDAEKVAKWVDEKNQRSSLKVNDIILSTRGTVGFCAIIKANILPAQIDQDIARIFIQDDDVIPEFLLAYMNCNYGQDWMKRNQTGMVQQGLSLQRVREFPIPLLSIHFQLKVKQIITSGHDKLSQSQSTYKKAETLLLDELGLHNWQPTKANTEVKSFKNSFLQSGRLDAEYYQPKYDEVEDAIKQGSVYYKSIATIRTFNARGLQPEYVEDGELSIINSKHILENTLDYEDFEKTSADYWNLQTRARIFRNDILTYTTGANIGRTQVYLSDEKALASNHVNILRIINENPIYVAFVMNSLLGRLQTEKLSAGSAQQELYPTDIDYFLIPFISVTAQKQITKNVIESLNLQQQSQHLLQVAKQAVEIAIEQSEEVAMEFIKTQTIPDK